ncbi:MAG TPA: metallophosphoesterase family protein [Clostridium sp.]|uniref:metallophosphoesterase family protein n=1 Tax=Clostridium sp. TaxID=1506 RepID=UPI002F927061
MSKNELYTIGVDFKNNRNKYKTLLNTNKPSWSDLNNFYELPFPTGEAYRQFIKKRQGKDGTLKKQEVIRDIIVEKKLDQVREIVGELDIKKQQIRDQNRQLNALKKDFIKSVSVAEDIKDYLSENCTIIIPEYCHETLNVNNSKYKMIVHMTDWHIGYVIDNCKGNYYNWEIANKRVDKLISECYKYIELYGISNISVVNTGDIIEHTYMRANQSQFCEFTQSEQINKAIKLIYRFLCALSKYTKVEYDSIYGNHDRINGDKKVNLDGDNAEVIIREQLKTYVEITDNKRVTVIDRSHTDKEIVKSINGLKCKFIHGEDSTKDGKRAMRNEISVDNQFYDVLFKGHLHNFNIESENNGRYVIYTGCLSGYNDYSVKFGATTFASQTICIVDDNGKIELIKDVILQ